MASVSSLSSQASDVSATLQKSTAWSPTPGSPSMRGGWIGCSTDRPWNSSPSTISSTGVKWSSMDCGGSIAAYVLRIRSNAFS